MTIPLRLTLNGQPREIALDDPRVVQGAASPLDQFTANDMADLWLGMMLAGTEPEQIMKTFGTEVQTRLDGLEKAHRMVIEGAMGTQAGKQPEEIAETVRQVAA